MLLSHNSSSSNSTPTLVATNVSSPTGAKAETGLVARDGTTTTMSPKMDLLNPLPLSPLQETTVVVGVGRVKVVDVVVVVTGVEAKEVAKELAKAVAGQYRVKGTLHLVMLLKC